MSNDDKNNRIDLSINTEILQHLTQNSFDVISILANDGTIKFESSAIERITGYAASERLGRSVFEFVHPYDFEYVFKEFSTRDVLMKKVEFRISHKNGHWVWLEAIGQNFLDNPTINGILVNSRDITERKKTDKQIKLQSASITQSPSIIMMTDIKGNIEYVNPSFEKASGYTIDEVIGENPRILKSGKHSKEFYKNIWDKIERKKHWKGEIYNRKKNGDFFWELVNIFPILDKNGNITNYIKTSEDITETKKIETALKESELQYKALFNDNYSVILLIDPKNGNIKDANKAACNFYGYSHKQITQMKISQVNTLSEKEIYNEMQSAKNEKRNTFYFKHKLKSGIIKDVEVYSGKIVIRSKEYLYSIINDISERRQAEEALKKSEAKFKALVNNASDGLHIFSPQTGVEYVSPAFMRINGYSEQEELNRTEQDFGQYIHPEDKDHTLQMVYSAIANKETHLEYQYRWLHKKGHYIWRKDKITFEYNEKGDYQKAYMICSDITKEVETQKQKNYLSAIIENTENICVIKDLNLKVIATNDSFAKVAGKSSVKELIGKTDAEIFNMSQEEEPIKGYMTDEKNTQKLKKGERILREEIIIYPDKSIKTVLTTKFPVYDNTNKLIATANISTDITKLKDAEQQIKEQNTELQKLNDDKNRFMRILGHDLKNPFNALLGFSNLLSKNIDKYDKAKISKMTTSINKVAQNTYNLLIDLLLWSKSQSGNLPFEPSNELIENIFQETKKELIYSAQQKDIEIKYFEAERTMLNIDKNMFKTIFRNLISNAIKFSYRNSSVNVYCEKIKQQIIITISDSGVGIKQEDIKKLWNLARPYSTQGTENEQGTGLGLLLVKEFVEKHNGKVWVESEYEKGSDFKISIPITT